MIKTVFVILLGTVMALFVTAQRNNKINLPLFSASLPVTVTPIDKIQEVSVMDSPEGSKTLTLQKQKSNDLTSYSLFVSLKSGEQKQQIFKREGTGSATLSIPYNTWSPSNTYVFLKETNTAINDYLVFQSSGSLFPNNLPYLSVQKLFKEKVPNYIIEDVTGWADLSLLIVNTKLIGEDKKVSFWFDIPSQSFIPLGTYFK